MSASAFKTQSAFTLTELMLASLLLSIIGMGLYTVDVTRLRVQNDLRRRTGATSDEMLAELAALHMQKNLELADRVDLLDSNADSIYDGMLVRTTTGSNPADPSDANNYRWDEYRLNGTGDLLYFRGVVSGACPPATVLARQITALTYSFRQVAQDPPAGQVFTTGPEDNNVVNYSLSWNNGTQTHDFSGTVTMRLAPYQNLGAAGGDSGGGIGGDLVPVPTPPC